MTSLRRISRNLSVPVAIALIASRALLAQGAAAAQDAVTEFEVASIKPNTSLTGGGGSRRLPDGTFTAIKTTIQSLIGLAYRSDDNQYRNLPDWARRDRFDVTTKTPAGFRGDARPLWKHFFADRMKLAAHEEIVDTPIFLLERVRQDRLGPQMKVSSLDCDAIGAAARAAGPPREPVPFPTEDEMLASCGILFGARIVSGGTKLQSFVPSLASIAGRPIEDRTGLTGYYAFTLNYTQSRGPAGAAPTDPAAPPDIFTALREQLGLQLTPSRKPMTTVVVDHIERPTEN